MAMEPVLERFTRGLPLPDTLTEALSNSFNWSSPYFVDSGYESLKQLGLHLVSDEPLRDGIVHLFETTYAYILGEQNEAMYRIWEALLLPVRNRELENVDPLGSGPRAYRVRDHEGAMRRGELLNALLLQQWFLQRGIDLRREARAETLQLVEHVEGFLLAH